MLLGTVLLLVLTWLYGEIFVGTSTYFSFADLASSSHTDLPIWGLILRLLVPVLVGFAVAAVSTGNPRKEATLSGAIGSFLHAWPALYVNYVPQFLEGQRARTMVVYGLFVLSYTALANLGALLAFYWAKATQSPRVAAFFQGVQLADAVRDIVLGLIASAVWQLAIELWP